MNQPLRNLIGSNELPALSPEEIDPDVYAGMFLFHIEEGESFHLGDQVIWNCQRITSSQITLVSSGGKKLSIKHHGSSGAYWVIKKGDFHSKDRPSQCVRADGFFVGKHGWVTKRNNKLRNLFDDFWRNLSGYINMCQTSSALFRDDNEQFILSVIAREEML
jgi:hypothetical protein